MLEGLRVVEIAGIGPGPFCAMHLADLGADVVTVQKPAPARKTSVNRGKRSIVLDLKASEGREAALELISSADVVIEGMRPGTMERLGLGPEVCRARNPKLVYGRMTGWGQTGPLASAAGHDANYISLSGGLWNASPAGQPPITPFSVVGDIAGGALYLTIGILSGVLHARATGDGCVVDAAIVDGSAHALQLLLAGKNKGTISETRGESIHDASHFYWSYRCRDGLYLTVAAIEPQFYHLFLEKLGLDGDPDFGDQWDRSRWARLKEKLQALFVTRTRTEWWEMFEGSDACVAPVLSPEEAAANPHMKERSVYFTQEGFLQSAPAPRFDSRRVEPGPIPEQGQHSVEIIEALRAGSADATWLSQERQLDRARQ